MCSKCAHIWQCCAPGGGVIACYRSVECLSVVFVSRESVFMFWDSWHTRLHHSSVVIA